MGLPRKDVVGPLASWTFYWDRHDEGVFIGNRGSGKGVHVDQVLWSNARASQLSTKRFAAIPGFFLPLRWERIGVATNWLRPGRKEPSKTQEQTETRNIVLLFKGDLGLCRQYFVSIVLLN